MFRQIMGFQADNGVFRQIMGSDWKELTRNFRKMHAYELHDLSCT